MDIHEDLTWEMAGLSAQEIKFLWGVENIPSKYHGAWELFHHKMVTNASIAAATTHSHGNSTQGRWNILRGRLEHTYHNILKAIQLSQVFDLT